MSAQYCNTQARSGQRRASQSLEADRQRTHSAPLVRRLVRAARLVGRRVEALGQQPPQLARAEPRVDRVLAGREVAVLFHERQQKVQLLRAHPAPRQRAAAAHRELRSTIPPRAGHGGDRRLRTGEWRDLRI